MLDEAAPSPDEAMNVQAANDFVVFLASAAASLSSGRVYALREHQGEGRFALVLLAAALTAPLAPLMIALGCHRERAARRARRSTQLTSGGREEEAAAAAAWATEVTAAMAAAVGADRSESHAAQAADEQLVPGLHWGLSGRLGRGSRPPIVTTPSACSSTEGAGSGTEGSIGSAPSPPRPEDAAAVSAGPAQQEPSSPFVLDSFAEVD